MRRSALRRGILYHTPAQYANISWKEQKAEAEENVSFPSAHCRYDGLNAGGKSDLVHHTPAQYANIIENSTIHSAAASRRRNARHILRRAAAVRTSGASDKPRRFFRSVSSQSHGAHRIQCHQRGAEAHCRVRLFQSEPSPCARGVISEFSYARGGIRGRLVWRSAPLFRTLYNTTRFVLFRGRRIVYPAEQPPSGKKTAAGLRPNCGQTASFQAFVKAAQRPSAEGHSCGARSASMPVPLRVPKEFCLNAS